MDIRRVVTTVDETRLEAGRPVSPPIRRVVTAAVLVTPFAGRYVEDLEPLIEASVPLGAELVAIAVKELGGRAVHSYGKGGIVGMKGELEHVAAMLHPKFGTPLREGVGGGRTAARIPYSAASARPASR